MREIKKKTLSLFITLLALAFLATPIASAMGVKRNLSDDFTATVRLCDPTTTPPGSNAPGPAKYVGPKDSDVPPNPANPENRKYQLTSGATFFGVINSDQLGEGTMTSILIIGIMDQEAGMGFGVFKWKCEFDNEICKGTIEGIYKGEQTLVFPSMDIEGSALLCKGTGDLQNVKIEVYSYMGTLNVLIFTTLGFSADAEGTIWGWTPP